MNRKIEERRAFTDIFITDAMAQYHALSLKETNSFAPLYLYHEDGTRTANFDDTQLASLLENLTDCIYLDNEYDGPYGGDEDKVVYALDVLDYIYAALHSPTYRAKYKEFLKTDFPRVPRPASWAEFWRLVPLGRQLRELHLMQSADIDDYTTTYPVSGNNEVEQIKYVVDESSSFSSADSDGRVVQQGKLGRVYLNNSQYFGNVPDIAWNFYIGGYQPAQKWLKDRLFSKTSKPLSDEDLNHYQRIIRILLETDRLMHQIG